MAETYKVYFLERSNQVVGVRYVTADDDEAAVKAARKLRRAGMCEVWQGERRVATIDLSRSGEPSSASLWL